MTTQQAINQGTAAVMHVLARLPRKEAMEAMTAINVTVRKGHGAARQAFQYSAPPPVGPAPMAETLERDEASVDLPEGYREVRVKVDVIGPDGTRRELPGTLEQVDDDPADPGGAPVKLTKRPGAFEALKKLAGG